MKTSSGSSSLTLYVVPGCPLCAQARAWLAEHDINFIERDVAQNFGALRVMYQLTGQRFVPVFERNGRALVRPSDDELAQFLLH
ncbi:MAG TPA: glutaredoxin family protein [Pyrinomonadaceae bacterium]|nr:glutaredoxin family protein [Pyrinomonadaceae bacterium]